jgi:hypothetical protein
MKAKVIIDNNFGKLFLPLSPKNNKKRREENYAS